MIIPSPFPSHSSRVLPPAVYELKKRLGERFGPGLVRFVVFGSYARGDNTPDSDIDVMVSLAGRMNARVKEEILKMAFEIELEMDVLFDIKAFSERDIQETLVGATPFMENVLREGFSI